MADMPWIISVDDHVVEPANVWIDRLPKKYHDVGPRIVRAPMGEITFIGGKLTVVPGSEGLPDRLVVLRGSEAPPAPGGLRGRCPPRRGDHAGCDLRGHAARFLRGGAPARGHGHQPPRSLTLLPHLPPLLRPDLHRGQGQGARSPLREGLQRLDGRGVVRARGQGPPHPPHPGAAVDAELAAEEVRRNADRGVRAVCFSEIPPFLGLPSVHDPDHYWDPFFQACEETKTVINMHIGSSSKMPSTSADAPPAVGSTLTHSNATYSMVDFMFSGVLVRFPELKLAYAEGQIGWIPYILERADKVWEENRGWGGVADIVPEPPSTYFHRQIYGCFFDDAFGLKNVDAIGVDNITYESDYPHSDSTWPNTRQIAEKQMKDLTDEQIYKIVRGNAIKLYDLDFK